MHIEEYQESEQMKKEVPQFLEAVLPGSGREPVRSAEKTLSDYSVLLIGGVNTVIFDFDYTLGDSTDGIVLCVTYGLEQLGDGVPSFEEIKSTIGLSLAKTYKVLTGNTDKARADRFSNLFKEKADEVMVEHAQLYPGVKELLVRLRENGYRIGIVTTKFQYRIRHILQKFDAEGLVDVIVGTEDVTKVKPDPEGLLLAIRQLGVKREEVLYVGDSFVDAQAAERAGVRFAGVLTGTTTREEFEKYPHAVIGAHVGEICDFIENMDESAILNFLEAQYPIATEKIEFLRDSGSVTYAVYGKNEKYFLRITKPLYYETAKSSLEIHLYLQSKGCNVPKIIFTREGKACIPIGEEDRRYAVLYEFLEGEEVAPEQDAEEIGRLLGRFHNVMTVYAGELKERGKDFFVERYIEILRKKNYKRVEEYVTYGKELWESVKALPRAYCHGDMYNGNIHKTTEGKLYLLDFDTSCRAFSMYDLVLIANRTDYFEYKEDGYVKTKEVFLRVLSEYQKVRKLTEQEIGAFYKLLALYHFALQATIVEIFGLDCIDETFIDKQLDWLYRWKEECKRNDTW